MTAQPIATAADITHQVMRACARDGALIPSTVRLVSDRDHLDCTQERDIRISQLWHRPVHLQMPFMLQVGGKDSCICMAILRVLTDAPMSCMPSWRSCHSAARPTCAASANADGIGLVTYTCSRGAYAHFETRVCPCDIWNALRRGHTPMRCRLVPYMRSRWADRSVLKQSQAPARSYTVSDGHYSTYIADKY